MSRRPFAAVLLAVVSFAPISLVASGPEPVPTGSSGEAEPLAPVPPVEGIPGPLFFETPTLAFVPKGTIRITSGASWFDEVEMPASGLAGDLARLGLVRVDIGFGSRIEVRVQGAVQQVLRINADSSNGRPPTEVTGETTHDAGDFSVLTIAQATPERGWIPAFGLRVEVKLPNTNEKRRIGTNTTDVLLSVPGRKRFGRLVLNADLGLGILTVPTNAQSQTDVLLYGLAVAWEATPKWMLYGELVGRWAPTGGHPGTGSHSVLRGGASYSYGPTAVGVIFSRGLSADAERFGLTLAVSFGFRVFDRVRAG